MSAIELVRNGKFQIFEPFLRAARRVAFGVVLLSLIASAATGVIAV